MNPCTPDSPPNGPISGARQRRARHLALRVAGIALLGAATTLSAPRPAAAQEFRLHLEPALALWLDTPQSDHFNPGFYGAIRPSITIGPVVALQAGYSFIYSPAADGYTDDGTGHLLSAGVRLRPFATVTDSQDQLGGLFVDGNMGYLRTGDADRFALDVGLGYAFQVASTFALGPVVRYTHIVQPSGDGNLDGNDGQLLTVGLNLSFGPAPDAPPEPKPEPEAVVCAPPTECAEAVCAPPAEALACVCVDTDKDGVCDADDRCPTLSGPAETHGCPVDPCTGRPIVVVVQFEHNSSAMPEHNAGKTQTMDPVLDAVAAAIAKDPSCRVCIIGHASEEGSSKHNQKLSAERANQVQTYMVGRGLAKKRILASGLGERCPMIPANTRLANRRVEFRRLLEGDRCPTDCAPAVDAP